MEAVGGVRDHGRGWIVAAPGVFVVLWSSGFIGAKYGLPYAEPLTFLLTRFLLVIIVMLGLALAMRAPWPQSRMQTAHVAAAGVLLHGGYLGGVFSAIHHGMPTGLVALIAGLQPVLTAVLAGPLLGERIVPRQWAGFALGIAGVALVVSEKISWSGANWAGLALSVIALCSITAGTLYQKRYCGAMDLRSGGVIQFGAASLVLGPLAYVTETMHITWSGEFIFALAWLVGVLSFGAVSLLYLLIRRGEASRVSSLFYLTPVVTALMAFVLFGEKLGMAALMGMAVAVTGVALVVRR